MPWPNPADHDPPTEEEVRRAWRSSAALLARMCTRRNDSWEILHYSGFHAMVYALEQEPWSTQTSPSSPLHPVFMFDVSRNPSASEARKN